MSRYISRGSCEPAKMAVGRPIDAGDVVSASAGIVWRTPAIMLPQGGVVLLSILGDLVGLSPFDPIRVILGIGSVVLAVIVAGAYPSMVRAVLEGGRPSVAEAVGKAYHRFWSLVAAGILVVLIVGLGAVALLVPGIIFATWYAYTIPAMMLEEKGALKAMEASKAFGRDKKFSTFAVFVVVVVVGVAFESVGLAFSLTSHVLGELVTALLGAPFAAWGSVAFSYAYLRYGPSSIPAPPPAEAPPQPPASPDASVAQPPSRFCASCGSPVKPGARFCTNCGKPV